ncbi:hypothetical protein H0W32_03265 [Patescibacteria group bacterium]|nr:hypothetical protein [Patescibacteria group bacterium]
MKRYELFSVIGILLVIFSATYINLGISLRRSRDNQRKSDLRSIANGLVGFQADYAFFPYATTDKITACVEDDFDPKTLTKDDQIPFVDCEWGVDAIRDILDLAYPAYQDRLPRDPKANEGSEYLYISNGRRFQLFAYLEGGSDDIEYKPEVEARQLMCGNRICNFGAAFSSTPLDKTLEEYENELKRLEEQ